ncbi:MAG: hypothetical protein EXS03_05315 [Phycisphaerales bacterium]|nr:hypothetical protein [Phycisphaerales bacterium]
MRWIAPSLCGLLALTFTALAATPTIALARFFTHPLLAERAGVEIRAVSFEGAALFRLACALAALAWIVLPWTLAQCAASQRGAEAPPLPSARPASAPMRGWRLALLAAVAVGLALRFMRLGESFWFDEISALLDYAQYGSGAILGTYFVQSNHVLHTLLSGWMIELAGGVNEAILRIPALFAGIAAIGAVSWLAREATLWRSDDESPSPWLVAWLSSAAAALSPILVLESVEARGYSMMVLFAALASALLLRAWRPGAARGAARGAAPLSAWPLYSLYAIVCALGVWTHLAFVALPAGHALVAIARIATCREGSRTALATGLALALALALAAVTAFAVLAPLLPELLSIRSEFSALDGNEPRLISLEGLRIALSLGQSWWWDALPGLALVAIAFAGLRRHSARRVPLAVSLAGLPLLVAFVAISGSWMYARFAVFALPGAILALALGASDLLEASRRRGATRLVAVGLGALAAMWITTALLLPPKQPIRDAVEYLDARAQVAATIASAGLPDNVAAYYGVLAEREIADAGVGGRDLASLTPSPQWLIVLYPRSLDPECATTLSREWTLEASFDGWVDWDNGAVLVYRKNTP